MKTQQTTISEVRLVYRTKVKASDRQQIKYSNDVFDIFMENWELDSIEHIEEFKLMLMTRSNKVLGIVSLNRRGVVNLSCFSTCLSAFEVNVKRKEMPQSKFRKIL